MRLESVHVSNFRSLRDVTVEFDGLTVLIGPNSSGKTSVLEALRFFGEDHITLSKHDFFYGTTTMEIEATVDPEGSGEIPREYLVDEKVTVQRLAELENDGKVNSLLRVKKMCIGDLVGIRDMRTAKERQAGMKALLPKYPGLRHTAAWPGNLNSYEHDHIDDPAHRDKYAPHFIDLEQSGLGSGRLLDIMYVPAARDIEADARDGGMSLLGGLIDMTVRRSGAHEAKLQEIADAANRRAKKLMRAVNREGSGLAGRVRTRARAYADNMGFRLDFTIPELQNARPRATLTLLEDGLPIPIDRAGSGAQRVYLMALLETIYLQGGAGEAAQGGAGDRVRVMLIDEPELYQHPQRQGRILRALGNLSKSLPIQVVCSTHSPYFVWLEEIGRIRRLQRVGMETAVCRTTVARIADSVNRTGISRNRVGEARMAALLDLVSSRWIAEGLFARLVVLVEGPGDRSMLLATARAMGVSLDELEVTIVPCGGKPEIPHVLPLFRHLGVPAYLVWDADAKCKDRYNRRLNLGLRELADPGAAGTRGATETRFGPRYSCHSTDLAEATIRKVGDPGMLLTERMGCHGLDASIKDERKRAIHNQRIMYEVLEAMRRDGRKKFSSLPTVRIIRQVARMRGRLRRQDEERSRKARAALRAPG